ncbi:MAG: Ig-like domain-containing protein [Prevotella sp.]|nr:Ig-like domain-containing protein [Prevotella sp.]
MTKQLQRFIALCFMTLSTVVAHADNVVTAEWSWQNNLPAGICDATNFEGKTGTLASTVDGISMFVDATSGKLNSVGRNNAQCNSGTILQIPVVSTQDVVTVVGYPNYFTYNFNGGDNLTNENSYTATRTDVKRGYVAVNSKGGYVYSIKVEQHPDAAGYKNQEAKVVWDMKDPSNTNAHTATPEEVFSLIAFNSGDTEITGTSNITDGDAEKVTTGIKFRPSGSTTSLEWSVKPASGLTFTPTKLTGYVNRCGTDVENGITISAYAEGNAPTTLGTWTALRSGKTRNNKPYDANAIYKYEITLTAEQQAALTSGDGFHLVSTVGTNSGKEGAFGEVTIEGLINGEKADVELFTLTTIASPEAGGNTKAYPMADEYEAGSEVTLTAVENFGYDFVNWTNATGEVVSTDAKFNYTVTANETLTANFKKVNTYELALTVDGTNDYMVALNPAPTMVDGKQMYEEGQTVEMTANQYEGLVTFTNWSDGETVNSKVVSMTENISLTANYAQVDIIAGWDFYQAGGNGRKADFAAADNDGDALNLVNTETGETSGWLDKSALAAGGYESFAGAAVNWRTGSKNGDVGNWHWQTKINAEAFEQINVQFEMLYNYNAYQTYNAEYSLNGTEWHQFGSITMEGAKNAASFHEQLPVEANNQKELYIRMLADKTSKIDGTASANDGNTLAMFFITGTPKLVDDGKAPTLISSVPAKNATNVSASGKIVLTFDEHVKIAENANAIVAIPMPTESNNSSALYQDLTPVVSGKTITFEYKGLGYGSHYEFQLTGNAVSDLTGNFIADDIIIPFTTMQRPAVQKGLYDAVVENVDELLAAIKAADSRSDKNVRFRIFMKNGTYTLPLSTTETISSDDGNSYPSATTKLSSSNISLIGESRDGVIITNDLANAKTYAGQFGTTSVYDGISKSDVLQIQPNVSGLYFQELTVKSGIGDALGRNIVIHDRGTKNIYKNVRLHGYQDTWTSNNDRGLYYFEGGIVRGRTDYLCGKGDIFFNGIELLQVAGGYAAVPSKPAAKGWVFKDCVINGDGNGVSGNYTLGRPWGSGTPIALFIDTKMNVVPSAIGWSEMSNGWPARFAEWNSMTSTGSQIDLSGRKTTFGDGHKNDPRLTAEEAQAASDMREMYGDWYPTMATEQAAAPSNVKIDGAELTWDDSNYALLWAIVKNGNVVDFTITPSYTIDDKSATYAVRAANEMGGLSEAVEAENVTGIESASTGNASKADDAVYNLQGIRIKVPTKGVFIINGKKMAK